MGSPHVLYVIAKVNGRYRSLAVLYRHYDNKGEYAVDACRRLIEIFEEPRNRALLLHELQLASSLPPEKWEVTPEYRNERPAFPFVATCLLLGASVAPETGHGYNATHEPFNMPLMAAPEGCTVLDVTDPASVRYAFVFVVPQGDSPAGLIRTAFGNTPLTAWEYAAFYGDLFHEEEYRIGEDDAVIARTHARFTEILKAKEAVDSTVIASPLIDEDALESAWPNPGNQQSWMRRADLGLPVTVSRPPSENDPALSHDQSATHHAETTLHKAFERSYKLFEPGYNEGLDTEFLAPVSPVKQVANILYLGSLDDSPWQTRAAEYQPKDTRMMRGNGVQYFTFQVDDSLVTPGQTLDVMKSWMVAATAQKEIGGMMKHHYYVDSTNGQSDQNMVKFFGMAGPVRNDPFTCHTHCTPPSSFPADTRPGPPGRQAPTRPSILLRQKVLPQQRRLDHRGPRGDQARRVDCAPRPAVAPGTARLPQDGDDPPGFQVCLRQPLRRRRDPRHQRGDISLSEPFDPGGRRAPRARPWRGNIWPGAGGSAPRGRRRCQWRPGVTHGKGRGFGAAWRDGRCQGSGRREACDFLG